MKRILHISMVMMIVLITSVAWAEGAGGYIEAEGVIYYEKGMTPNQMRRMSIMDAYRYLAEEVDALNVTSETTVKNLRKMNDTINIKVTAALRGAKVISVNRESDGSFHAIVRLPTHGGSESLAGAVLQENIRVEEFLEPKFVNIRSEINYTGLVIDCRGLKLKEAIAPAIKTVRGKEIYAYKNIGYEKAVEKGIVEYTNEIKNARAGERPLIVKAVKIAGKCDVIVSEEDAEKILSANKLSKILVNCAVVLVR